MDLSKTGSLLVQLRREKEWTQSQLAQKLGVCAKTISKWETGRGFPDVSILAELSEVFEVDILKLLEGKMPNKKLESCSMKRTKFYVCRQCGNVITSAGDAQVICCGRTLPALRSATPDDAHALRIDKIEDEYYIAFAHPMTKAHYISFVSYVHFDRVLTVKLYPEQDGALRFAQMRGGKLYYYCSEHGLFELKI